MSTIFSCCYFAIVRSNFDQDLPCSYDQTFHLIEILYARIEEVVDASPVITAISSKRNSSEGLPTDIGTEPATVDTEL